MFQFLMRGDSKINALRELHALEVAAEAIYRRQMWRAKGDLAESLVHAAENEKKHKDTFFKQIEKLGGKPHFLRHPMYLLGSLMGFAPSVLGRWAMMMNNILFETQAVYDYKDFLMGVELDDDSKRILLENIEDEKEHIRTWETYLWGENVPQT